MEEFIPTFETIPTNKENNILIRIDEFEDKIREIDKLTKQYDALKKEIKSQMVNIGKEHGLSQVKWITPNGTQITCSIGQPEETKEITEKRFSEDKLKEKYPEIYKECCVDRTYLSVIKAKGNDTLRITLPKGE